MFNPPNDIAFMSAIPSTSGRLHSEFVSLLFLQAHRETDRFFTDSGVQLPEPNSGLFHFRHTVFSSELRAKVGRTLAKAEVLRVNLNLDGTTITLRTHTHPITLANISSINLVSIFRCSGPPSNPVYVRSVDP
jgi:hypothetical protein